jgi:hypothetical protein
MNLHPRQFLLKSDELMLIKAEYPYSIEELGAKLFGISSQERRFIRNIHKYVPIHSEITNGCYWEYCLVDQKFFEGLTKLVNKHEIDCKLTDVSKQFIDNSIHIDKDFKEKVIEYIHCVMELDTILDRLNLIGINQLNDFEMFYLERASKGYVKI